MILLSFEVFLLKFFVSFVLLIARSFPYMMVYIRMDDGILDVCAGFGMAYNVFYLKEGG